MIDSQRQQYGLGSFVKKIAKGAKKVFKSPLGKAAILGGLGMYGTGTGLFGSSGMFSGARGAGFLRGLGASRNFIGPKQATLFQRLKGGLGKFGYGKAALLGGGALATALPFLGGDEEDEDIIDDWSVTPNSISKIRDMARKRDPSLAFMPAANYVQQGYYGAKDGGIIGLANGGQPAEAQAEQMLKMEYQKYRNQGGTLSYQEFKMQVMQQAQGQGSGAQGQPQMAAQGGRIGLKWGGDPDEPAENIFEFMQDQGVNYDQMAEGVEQEFPSDDLGAINLNEEQMTIISDMNDKMETPDISLISTISGAATDAVERFIRLLNTQAQAQGGRIGYENGELVTDESMVEATPAGMMEENVEEVQGEPTREQMEVLSMKIFQLRLEELDEEQLMVVYQAAMEQQPEEMAMQEEIEFNPQMAQGQPQMDPRQMAAEGGIMNLGGMEKDYRAEGGFVPIGGKEKADDVPARLSKNEFVFTADAVRNAGGGDIDAGAEVMENMMENLEAGGQISEESQGGGGEEMISEEEIVEGPNGAQEMYDQQQMLQSRMG